jgi:hypothetical protein
LAATIKADKSHFLPSSSFNNMRIISSAIFLVGNAVAFQPSIITRKSHVSVGPDLRSALIEDELSTRRDWAAKSVTAASALVAASAPRAAKAAEVLSPEKQSSKQSVLCDPSVSTFRNPKNNRLVYILGTAHISSASADVAGELVRSIKPSAVFVELDVKRVGRAIPKPVTVSTEEAADVTPAGLSSSSPSMGENSLVTSSPPPSLLGDAVQTTSQQDSQPPTPKKNNPFNLKEKLLNKASQAVGNSIKGLYSKLESDGFSAGEEFVVAVREGLNIGSKIILGDQDVEVSNPLSEFCLLALPNHVPFSDF